MVTQQLSTHKNYL